MYFNKDSSPDSIEAGQAMLENLKKPRMGWAASQSPARRSAQGLVKVVATYWLTMTRHHRPSLL